ncbi:hypothetical protein E8E13_006150 [Curvularia kusanoi]|uniref:Uncharacterized protein n=1 Tax=Curvularia kusanoi TaxID=90978 RepID=A0A9P4TMD8_CURKU|nr:hypothetical protein E8E13_006150 [Curvularia kusanoi]
MRRQQRTCREIIATNDEWSVADCDRQVGMLMEGSMFPAFPANKRDPRFWGEQDPLEWVHSGGPYDEDDGDQSWRIYGSFMYTGDSAVESVKPNKVAEQRYTDFWRTRDAQQAGAHQAHNPPQDTADSDEAQFPDALPRPLIVGPAFLSPSPARHTQSPEPQPTNTQTTQPSSRASSSQSQGTKRKRSQGKQGVPGPVSQDTAGSAYAAQAQAPPRTTSSTKRNTAVPKTARAGPPPNAAQWNDENLFILWRHKVTLKKGYKTMLPDFPGHTIDSLTAVWRARRERCEELGFQWRVAGRPEGRVEEWLEE